MWIPLVLCAFFPFWVWLSTASIGILAHKCMEKHGQNTLDLQDGILFLQGSIFALAAQLFEALPGSPISLGLPVSYSALTSCTEAILHDPPLQAV